MEKSKTESFCKHIYHKNTRLFLLKVLSYDYKSTIITTDLTVQRSGYRKADRVGSWHILDDIMAYI